MVGDGGTSHPEIQPPLLVRTLACPLQSPSWLLPPLPPLGARGPVPRGAGDGRSVKAAEGTDRLDSMEDSAVVADEEATGRPDRQGGGAAKFRGRGRGCWAERNKVCVAGDLFFLLMRRHWLNPGGLDTKRRLPAGFEGLLRWGGRRRPVGAVADATQSPGPVLWVLTRACTMSGRRGLIAAFAFVSRLSLLAPLG